MSSQVNKSANIEAQPEPAKKAWKKPVLDILDLQRAEYGIFTIHDGPGKHRSN